MQLRVYGGNLGPPNCFLVMDLCARPLSDIIHKRDIMPMREVIRVRPGCV